MFEMKENKSIHPRKVDIRYPENDRKRYLNQRLVSDEWEEIRSDELSFLRVSSRIYKNANIDHIKEYDAVIIEVYDDITAFRMIDKIRSHNEKKIYLIPVFLFGLEEDKHVLVHISDGLISTLSNLEEASHRTRKILSRI